MRIGGVLLVVVSVRVTLVPVAVAMAGYAGLWLGYAQDWAWLSAADTAALRAARDAAAHLPAWTAFWTAVSAVLGPTALRVTALVGIVAALVRGGRRTAAFLALTVLGMGLVTAAAKAVADRPRPGTALTVAASSSFPSGHAMGIMVAALVLVTVLGPRSSARVEGWTAVAGVLAVLLCGTARVALNVHHPSDVLAGWLLGYLWFAVCPQGRPAGSAAGGSSSRDTTTRRVASGLP